MHIQQNKKKELSAISRNNNGSMNAISDIAIAIDFLLSPVIVWKPYALHR